MSNLYVHETVRIILKIILILFPITVRKKESKNQRIKESESRKIIMKIKSVLITHLIAGCGGGGGTDVPADIPQTGDSPPSLYPKVLTFYAATNGPRPAS